MFAPAGLALTFVEELPNLVEKGRNRIEGRTAHLARVIGQFAVQMGFREVSRRARQLVDPEPPKRREAPRDQRPDAALQALCGPRSNGRRSGPTARET